MISASLRTFAPLGFLIALGACSSVNGPAPVVDSGKASTANEAYINGDVLGPYYSPDSTKRSGASPAQWRNIVVGAQLDAADRNYAAFVKGLRSERSSLALASDLVVVGLSEGAALAVKSTANALSAASAGIVAGNAAINKDVYYNATIEALISQMDADRATVRTTIVKALQGDDKAYPLDIALGDVRRYESAGTIERAIAKVNAAASAAKSTAEAKLDLVRDADFIAAQDKAAKLLDRIAALTPTQALAVLKTMAPKLSERSAVLQQNMKAMVPAGLDKISDGTQAQEALKAWLPIDERTPNLQKEWSDALDAATK